jgi:hypothetical protein
MGKRRDEKGKTVGLWKKRVMGFAVATAMSVFSVAAVSAESKYVSTDSATAISYDVSNLIQQEISVDIDELAKNATSVDSGTTVLSTGTYIVNQNVEISNRITVSGDVNLILADGYTLNAGKGINVSEGNSLTIYGQTNQTGALIIESVDEKNAGIGGNGVVGGDDLTGTAGTITICGGTVTAKGGNCAAGIGGGYKGAGGTISIIGGTVTAVGGENAAGIGGGVNGASGGTVTISGGTVTATGGEYDGKTGGAGIGGGFCDSGGTVTISGGTVIATGGSTGAGIGGGYMGAGGTVTISGGTVTATGNSGGAGIGRGFSPLGADSGTFSTTDTTTSTTGTAIVFASSISDTSYDTDETTGGIIFNGDTGKVYGTYNLASDLDVESGKTLIVPEAKKLTIEDGKNITNNGTIRVDKGTLKEKNISNNGSILYRISYGELPENISLSTSTASTSASDFVYYEDTDSYYATAGTEISITASGFSYGEGVAQWLINDVAQGDTANPLTYEMPEETIEIDVSTGKLAHIDNWELFDTASQSKVYEKINNIYKQLSSGDNADGDIDRRYKAYFEYIGYVWDEDANAYKPASNSDDDISNVIGLICTGDYDSDNVCEADWMDDETKLDRMGGKLTLSAPKDIIYDGAPKPVTVTMDKSFEAYLDSAVNNNIVIMKTETYEKLDPAGWTSLGVGEEPADAGDYRVTYTLTVVNKETGTQAAYTATLKYNIEKQSVSSPQIKSVSYNAHIQTADISDTGLYTVEKNKGGENAGDYEVKLKLNDSDNYEWSSDKTSDTITLTFTITQAENKLTKNSETTTWTYDGEAKSPDCTADFGTLNVQYESGDTVLESAPADVGTYTAVYTVDETDNYEGISETVDFEITKANGNLTVNMTQYTKTYGDSDFAIAYTTKEAATVRFASDNTKVATVNPMTNLVTIVGAGTAKITVVSQSSKNYNDESKTVTINVKQADISKCNISLNTPAGGYTYDGSEKKPGITVRLASKTLTENTDYTVSYSNNTNAGTATVTITGTGNLTGSKKETFKIAQAANKWTTNPEIEGWTYGENAKTPAYEAKYGNDTVRISYRPADTEDTATDANSANSTSDSDNEEYTDGLPTAAGDYIVRFEIAKTNNYAGLDTKVSLKIEQAEPILRVEETIVEAAYGDTDKSIKAEYAGDGNITYDISVEDKKVATVDESGNITTVGAGEAKVIVKLAATTNYKADSRQVTIKVVEASLDNCKISLDLPKDGYTYDGTEKTPTVTVEFKGNKLTEGTDYDISYGNNVNVGKETATVTVTGKGNFTGETTNKFTISQAQNKWVDEPADLNWTYGDGSAVPKYTADFGTVTVKYADTYVNGNIVEDSISDEAPTAAGIYKVIATVAADAAGNYTGLEKTVTLTISLKELTPSIVYTGSKVYDGTTSVTGAKISLAGVVKGDEDYVSATATFAYDSERVTTTDEATGEKKGATKVTATGITLDGDKKANYKLTTDEVDTDATITQIANEWVTGEEPAITGWTYGEEANAPTFEAKFGNNTAKVEYKKNDADEEADAEESDADGYTTEVPTEAGNYTVRVTIPATDDYGVLVSDGVEFTIAQKNIAGATVTLGDSLTYTGKPQEQTVTGVSVGDTAVTTYDVGGNAQTNAGTYTLTVTGTGNFTGSTTAEFTIKKAAKAPDAPASELTPAHTVKTVAEIELPAGWQWSKKDKNTELADNEAVTATAEYIGKDAENYETESVEITITRQPCEHKGGTATCTAQAVCTTCKEAYGDVDKTNHTDVVEKVGAKDATCIEDGYTGDTKCNDCGATIKQGETVKATGHTGGTATCVAQAVCTKCNEPYGDVDKANHTNVVEKVGAKEATCTEDGYTGDTKCNDCGAIIKQGETVKATGHTGGTATCVSGAICENCRTEYTEKNVENHTGNTEVLNSKAATCTENGYTGDTVCADCKAVLKTGTETSATGHKGGTATCTKKAVCTLCGKEYGELAAHTGGTANCVSGAVCENCGTEYTEKNAENHTGKTEVVNKKAATCIEKGYTGDTVCADCKAVLKTGTETSATGHTGGTATCTKKAVCMLCGKEYGELAAHTGGTANCVSGAICENCGTEYTEKNAENHTGKTEVVNKKAATCTEKGYTGDTVCADCKTVLETGTETSATGHKGGTATCKEPAVCENCNKPYGTITAHNYKSEITKDATAKEEGEITYTCSVCGDTYTESIPVKEVEPPYIAGDSENQGWDVIRNETEKAIAEVTANPGEEKTVTVIMNGAVEVPADIFEQIRGKDVTIVFVMDNGIKWSVDGNSVTGDKIKDINFEVLTEGKANKISDDVIAEVINNVTGVRYEMNLTLAYEGEFGFTAVMNIGLKEENAGYYANLFYHNKTTNKLEFICADKIATNGTANLTFTHASDYVIIIDEESLDPDAASVEDPSENPDDGQQTDIDTPSVATPSDAEEETPPDATSSDAEKEPENNTTPADDNTRGDNKADEEPTTGSPAKEEPSTGTIYGDDSAPSNEQPVTEAPTTVTEAPVDVTEAPTTAAPADVTTSTAAPATVTPATTETTEGVAPKTGDESKAPAAVLLLLLSEIGIALSVMLRRKKIK